MSPGRRKQQKQARHLYRLVTHSERWTWVPAIANMAAPTAAELNAGQVLSATTWVERVRYR